MAPVSGFCNAGSPITILHLITGLECAGAQNQLQQLILGSDNERFCHVVIGLLEGGSIARELKASGVEVYSLGMKRGVPSPAGVLRLAHLLRRLGPDILHCWLYHGCLMGLLGARLAGIHRMIWGLRSANFGLREYSLLTRSVVRLCARLSRFPQTIILNSEASRTVHGQLGYQTSRMRVIPNGVDTQHFRPDPEARKSIREELGLGGDSVLLGMFARYSPMKDHGTFLQAAALLHRNYPDVRFVLAGEDIAADNQSLWQLVRKNGLQQAAYLLGPRRDIQRLTAALDFACLSSWSESFPNVLVEAMACAVPCVASDVGDSSFIVGEAGRIVPPCNPPALAEAMGALVCMSTVERAVLGRRARERVLERFTLQKTVKAYEGLYRELSEIHGTRVPHGIIHSRT